MLRQIIQFPSPQQRDMMAMINKWKLISVIWRDSTYVSGMNRPNSPWWRWVCFLAQPTQLSPPMSMVNHTITNERERDDFHAKVVELHETEHQRAFDRRDEIFIISISPLISPFPPVIDHTRHTHVTHDETSCCTLSRWLLSLSLSLVRYHQSLTESNEVNMSSERIKPTYWTNDSLISSPLVLLFFPRRYKTNLVEEQMAWELWCDDVCKKLSQERSEEGRRILTHETQDGKLLRHTEEGRKKLALQWEFSFVLLLLLLLLPRAQTVAEWGLFCLWNLFFSFFFICPTNSERRVWRA